jgi:hypothetical protein
MASLSIHDGQLVSERDDFQVLRSLDRGMNRSEWSAAR